MGTGRQYDEEFKKQAIKLGKEVGIKAAAEELGIPKGTLGTWMKKARTGEIDTGSGTRTPEESLNLAEQLQAANKRIRKLQLFSLRAVGSQERRTVKVYCPKDR